MNSARSSHEICGLPHCLVDGFKHRMPDIPYEERCYVLTHYHSDHYGGLTSGWKHGRIYCSNTTANLICNVLHVDEAIVTRVEVGSTISIKGAKITFLDANHCPGAVILLFRLDNGLNHLHTGDMRYCSAMKSYPALSGVKIDKIYLDTTYAHPKHTFMTQDESISKIVTLAKEFIAEHAEDGIIYMSAYNLGKERVIFALSDAIDLPVYMDADKIHIMNQIPGGMERVRAGKFTSNPREGRIHICHMGFLGTLFPYFKPNFDGIKQHIEELNSFKQEAEGIRHFLDTPHCPMPLILHSHENNTNNNNSCSNHSTTPKVIRKPPIRAAIAFIPTGWADMGNFNRNHSMMSDGNVTVCTVPYSEHSNCPELVEFVKFLRPREVLPTVYSDEKNRLAILELFRNCVDRISNMRNFIAKFGSPAPKYKSHSDTESKSCIYTKTTSDACEWNNAIIGHDFNSSCVSGRSSSSTSSTMTHIKSKSPAVYVDLCSSDESDSNNDDDNNNISKMGGNMIHKFEDKCEHEHPVKRKRLNTAACDSNNTYHDSTGSTDRKSNASSSGSGCSSAWSCQVCTYIHTGLYSHQLIMCEMCGTIREHN